MGAEGAVSGLVGKQETVAWDDSVSDVGRDFPDRIVRIFGVVHQTEMLPVVDPPVFHVQYSEIRIYSAKPLQIQRILVSIGDSFFLEIVRDDNF